jgi:hypothetical protein
MCMTPGPRPVFERSHKSVESAPPPETPALIIVSECSQELGRGILCSAVTCSEGSLVVRCVSLISTGVPVWSCRQAGRQADRQAGRQAGRQIDMLSRRFNSCNLELGMGAIYVGMASGQPTS